MSLYKEWTEELENIQTEEQYKHFWSSYIPKETECYKKILSSKNPILEGTIKDLSNKFDMQPKQLIGFLDGASQSFSEELNLEELTEASEIKVELDFEKLLWNMHDAKADWLYGLDEWSNIFDDAKRKEIKKAYNRSNIVVKGKKIGRNEPCPCGSGKKYKKCCGK